LQYNHQRAFTFNWDIHGYAIEGFIVVEFNDGGGDIGADHPVFSEADAGGDEPKLYVGIVALRQKLLRRDV